MSNHNPTQPTPRSVAEWISFTIALCLLGTLIGLVVYSWVSIQDKPPIVKVKLQSDIRQFI